VNRINLSSTLALAVCAILLSGCSGDSPASLTASGKELLAKKQARAAAIQFKSALQMDAGALEARYLLGQALLEQGDVTGAAAEWTKAAEAGYDENKIVPALARTLLLRSEFLKLTSEYANKALPDAAALADLKTTLAIAWSAQGDRVRTESALQAALQAKPDFGPALIVRARILAGSGQFDEASKLIDAVLARDPARVDAWSLRGDMLMFIKKDEAAAVEAYRQALAVEASYLPAHGALLNIQLRRRDIVAMTAQVAQLQTVLPRHPQTMLANGQLAFVKRDFGKAREHSQTLLRLAPNHPASLLLAGAIELEGGSLLLAETHLTKALQGHPNLALARKLLAQTYLRMGQPNKVLAVLQPFIAVQSDDPEIAAAAGEAYLQLGDPSSAEAMFARATKLSPDSPRFRTALALSQLARGDAESAFNELQAVAARDSGSLADLALISAHLKRGEGEKALAAASALVAKLPKDAMALTTRARIHAARNSSALARADLESALGADPQYFPAAAALATLDMAEGKGEQARARFEKQLQIDPRNYLASLALAQLLSSAGMPADAGLQVLGDAIKSTPSEPTLRVALVNQHLLSKDFKAALAAAQQGMAALPDSADMLDALGRAQLVSGDLQQALSAFHRLAGLNAQSALPHLRLADTYLAMKDRASAEASLRRALTLQPNQAVAQRRLLQMTLADNRARDALEVARTIQKQQPKADAGYLYEYDIQLKLKNPSAAMAALRTGLKSAPSAELARRLHLQMRASGPPADAARFAAEWQRSHPDDLAFEYHLAEVAIVDKDLTQAEARLRRVVERQPRHSLALNNLASVMLLRGENGALAIAERANKVAPDQPAFMDTLASALAAEGKLAHALDLQKKAVDRAPETYVYRINLARIAIKSGDKAMARAELEKLARLGSRVPEQAEVAELLKAL